VAGDPIVRLPKAINEYQAATSTIEAKKRRDLLLPHAVEIIGNAELAIHEADPAGSRGVDAVNGHDFRDGLAGFGDYERLSIRNLLKQAGQMGLGIMDIDGLHGDLPD